MNILVANFRYLSLTGTETFTYTLLEALTRQKEHRIYFYSPFISSKMRRLSQRLNIFLTDNLANYQDEKIDVIHSHHTLCSILLRYYFPDTPLIYLAHGKIDWLDQPQVFIPHNYYGGISQEVCDHFKSRQIKTKKIFFFPNSVNIERFAPQAPLPLWPKKLLILSNWIDQDAKKTVRQAAKELSLNIKFIGKNKQKFAVEKEINQADIVMSLGRGIIEAMSCGKAALAFSHDHLHKTGDGMITRENVDKIAYSNFSGRARKIPFTKAKLIYEMKKYNTGMTEFNRAYIAKKYDITSNLKILSSIYTKAKQEKALQSNQKQIEFLAKSMQRILDYNQLSHSYLNLPKLFLKRFKDQLSQR